MRIGFITNLVEEDFAFCQREGIPCVEINLNYDMAPLGMAQKLNEWRTKYGVDISHVGLFGRDFISKDEFERAEHIKDLKKCMDFAADIGAPIITTGGGEQGERTVREACDELFKVLPGLLEYAHSKGLKYAFYNCHWTNFVTGPPSWDRILDRHHECGIKFDPTHPLYDHKDWVSQLRDFGGKVYHAHAKDTVLVAGRPWEDVPAGMGCLDWGAFFALLYHHGYAGDVNIEPHSGTWTGDRFYKGILLAKRHLDQFLLP